MKIIYAEDDEDLRELFSMKLQALSNAEVEEHESGNSAISALKNNKELAVIVSDFNMPDGDATVLYKYVKENKLNIPFILFSPENLEEHETFKTFKNDHPGNRQIDKPPQKGTLDEAIASAISFFKEQNPDVVAVVLEYLPVRLKMLAKLTKTPTDIFIKISDAKYVKMLHKGAPVDDGVIEKYKVKNIDKLYIKNDQYEAFINFCMDSLLDKLLHLDGKNLDEVKAVQADIFEIVQNQLINIGMSETVIALTKTTVESSIKMIEANPDLTDLLKNMKSDAGYTYEHSMLVSYVACGMSDHLDWSTEDTKEKLSIAAFMHDITIKDQDIALKYAMNDGDDKAAGIKQKEFNEFEKHPLDAAKLVSNTKNFPPDIDKIVSQHHELPLSKGFPRKLTSNLITPLSTVFIVAHKYIDLLYINDFQAEKTQQILDTMKSKFKSGNFRKSLNALLTLIHQAEF